MDEFGAKRFSTYTEAEAFLQKYFCDNFHPVRKDNRTAVTNYNKKVGEDSRLPLDLEIQGFRYVCKHYGNGRHRSKGLRKNLKFLPSGCLFHVAVNYKKSVKGYQIASYNLEHSNHPYGEEYFQLYSTSNRLKAGLKTYVEAVLDLEANQTLGATVVDEQGSTALKSINIDSSKSKLEADKGETCDHPTRSSDGYKFKTSSEANRSVAIRTQRESYFKHLQFLRKIQPKLSKPDLNPPVSDPDAHRRSNDHMDVDLSIADISRESPAAVKSLPSVTPTKKQKRALTLKKADALANLTTNQLCAKRQIQPLCCSFGNYVSTVLEELPRIDQVKAMKKINEILREFQEK